jgi:hypothetical protein
LILRDVLKTDSVQMGRMFGHSRAADPSVIHGRV